MLHRFGRTLWAMGLVIAFLASGAVSAGAAYEAGSVSNGGTIEGVVTYNGTIPTKRIVPTKDTNVCGKMRREPRVVVGDNNGVAQAVVFLKDISKGKPWPKDGDQVLDQMGCIFEPHVQVVRPGDLTIVNSDPVLHNTHGYYGRRTAFNVALPNKDQKVTKPLRRPGLVRVDCDAHGWMEAWVYVVEHPYVAVTGNNGTFSISDVPPGDYTLVVWQEHTGVTEVPVSVKAGGKATANIELKK